MLLVCYLPYELVSVNITGMTVSIGEIADADNVTCQLKQAHNEVTSLQS